MGLGSALGSSWRLSSSGRPVRPLFLSVNYIGGAPGAMNCPVKTVEGKTIPPFKRLLLDQVKDCAGQSLLDELLIYSFFQ